MNIEHNCILITRKLIIVPIVSNVINDISENKGQSFYVQEIQFLLMYMFQHDQVFTRTDIAKQSVESSKNIFQPDILFDTNEKNSKKRETFFWTKQQRELIEKDPKRVLFTSNYGTGKTLVMTAKAMQLGKLRRNMFGLKNQTETENDAQHGISFKKSSGVNLGKKGSHHNKKNKTNQENQIDPGKTFIFLFTNSDSLLFQKLCQEFEELKDHVEVLCSKGKIIKLI